MTDTYGKSSILALLHFAREQEQRMVERLSVEERGAIGAPVTVKLLRRLMVMSPLAATDFFNASNGAAFEVAVAFKLR
jgi:hypothetical protein